MKFQLDTNTCIRFINGRAPQIRGKMVTVEDTDIAISTVTKGEIYAGSAKSQHLVGQPLRTSIFPEIRIWLLDYIDGQQHNPVSETADPLVPKLAKDEG